MEKHLKYEFLNILLSVEHPWTQNQHLNITTNTKAQQLDTWKSSNQI